MDEEPSMDDDERDERDPPPPPPPPTRAETDRDADATDRFDRDADATDHATDRFYDADVTRGATSAMSTGRDYHHDAETSPRAPARWRVVIADARAAASARRSRTPSVAPLSPRTRTRTTRRTAMRDRDDPSARKRLEFTPAVRGSDRARSRAKPRLEEPGALLGATPFFTPTSGYIPTKSTAREIESPVKNLRF